jgi:hypothetical protein
MTDTLLELYVRRSKKLVVPAPDSRITVSEDVLASGLKNLEALGYGVDAALLKSLRALGMAQFVALYETLALVLQKLRGAHREFKPFYPNFPAQVMALSDARLYLNAIFHYLTDGELRLATPRVEIAPLDEATTLTTLTLGTDGELFGLIAKILGGSASLSETDQADLKALLGACGDVAPSFLPEAIPQKENAAFGVAYTLCQRALPEADALSLAGRYLTTATDVLRLAVALSGGDLSLAKPTLFQKISRPRRRLLLGLLERVPSPQEDMRRFTGRWLRLGEQLHPGELASRFPRAFSAFKMLRTDAPLITFGSTVETALVQRDVPKALSALLSRPGELARRLDHLLRLAPGSADATLGGFAEVATRVSTPVLLQVRAHFVQRPMPAPLRVFLPKGQVARARGIENNLPPLDGSLCERVVACCEDALRDRFSKLPPLGKAYLDPKLTEYNLPFAMRSSSKALRTVARGSRLPLPDAETLRLFVWWHNGRERTDIDLSATLFDDAFNYVDGITFYNLKSQGGVHSGDIVDAPSGACEFIDLDRSVLKKRGVRYIVMVLQSYTQQPYIELPECFAGWMARQNSGNGEIFEPRTVQDKLDITSDARAAIPVILDLTESRAIWTDLALKSAPNFNNTVAANLGGIAVTLRSMTLLRKPDVHSLLRLHIEARGTRVETPGEAETVFSVEAGTPFDLTGLASDYMA